MNDNRFNPLALVLGFLRPLDPVLMLVLATLLGYAHVLMQSASPAPFMLHRRATPKPSCRSTAQPFLMRSWKASSSAMKKALSQAPSKEAKQDFLN